MPLNAFLRRERALYYQAENGAGDEHETY